MSEEKLDDGKIMKMLNWTYDLVLNGGPGLDTAQNMAEDYLKGNGTLIEQINSLIRWQNTKAAVSGFISGLGGAFVLPVAVPANFASVMYVQIRMIAAIAYMGGYDIKDDRVKSLVYACLCGNAAKDLIKEVGIKVGTKITEQAIKKLSTELIVKINQKVGFRLLTKFGEKGAINLGKCLPGLGGVIGGTADCATTNMIGNIARNTFID